MKSESLSILTRIFVVYLIVLTLFDLIGFFSYNQLNQLLNTYFK